MTGKTPVYDQAIGPKDGVVELLLFQPDDWESDPLLIKRLRQRIRTLHEYAVSSQFQQRFKGAQPLLVVQGEQFPPEEVYDLLVKQEVEFRIGKVKRTVAKKPTPKPAAKPAAKTETKPKTAAKPAAKPAAEPAQGQKAARPVQQRTAQPRSAQTAQAQQRPAPRPKVVAPPPQPLPPEPEPWEVDEYDDFEPMSGGGQGSSGGFIAGIALTVLSALIMGYGVIMSMQTPPEPTLQSVSVNTVDGNTTKNNTYASVTVTPDPGTFSIIPIQDRKSTTAEYYVLFAAKENRSVLIFVPQNQSGILQVTMVEDPTDPASKKPKFTWAKKLSAKTFNGTLEKLQRDKNGPLELKLPDGFKDITKQYAKQSVKLPTNSMVLRVGAKPPKPSNSGGVVALVGLLLMIVFGFFTLVQRQRMQRSF